MGVGGLLSGGGGEVELSRALGPLVSLRPITTLLF